MKVKNISWNSFIQKNNPENLKQKKENNVEWKIMRRQHFYIYIDISFDEYKKYIAKQKKKNILNGLIKHKKYIQNKKKHI